MNKQTIERLVHAVLIENEEARSDDFILLFEVYSHLQPFIGGCNSRIYVAGTAN